MRYGGRAFASWRVGPDFESPPGHGLGGRQASLTLAVTSARSFKMFLVFKVGQKLYRTEQMLIVNNHADYK